MPINAILDMLQAIIPGLEMIGEHMPEKTVDDVIDFFALLYAAAGQIEDRNTRNFAAGLVGDLAAVCGVK